MGESTSGGTIPAITFRDLLSRDPSSRDLLSRDPLSRDLLSDRGEGSKLTILMTLHLIANLSHRELPNSHVDQNPHVELF